MNVVELVRVLWDDSVGNAGALRNCRSELVRRRDAERAVDALRERVPAPPADVAGPLHAPRSA